MGFVFRHLSYLQKTEKENHQGIMISVNNSIKFSLYITVFRQKQVVFVENINYHS